MRAKFFFALLHTLSVMHEDLFRALNPQAKHIAQENTTTVTRSSARNET